MISRPVQPNRNRFYMFVITGILMVVVIYNLFGLQIVKGSEYYFDSKNSFANFVVERAQRGLIYDRNGIKLVDNVPKFRLSILRKEGKTPELQKTFDSLGKLFKENIEEKYDTELERIKDYKNINEVKIFTSLDYNPYVFQIEANPAEYPLLKVEKYTQRKYLYPDLISHIIGYTGEIDAEDFSTGKYNYGDEIGKFGVEKGYDDILRGQNGIVRIDNYRAENKSISSNVQPRINGKDIYLTIDLNYQKKLYDLAIETMKRKDFAETKSLSAVVEDVNNGEILAMVSYPTFDSNQFVNGISKKQYDDYLNNPGKPLTNKATQYSQAPGSTFKLLTDMTALNEGAISSDTIFSTGGSFQFGGVTFYDAARKNWGEIDMEKALCVSSNIYHMKAALALDQKTGGQAAEKMNTLFQEMELNKVSGIDIGTESVGYFPTPEDKKAKGEQWFTGYMLNSSIGQGEVRLSPLGLTKLVSTVATDGKVTKQSIVIKKDGESTSSKSLDISKRNFGYIKDGMKCAADLNTGYVNMDPKSLPEIAVKTGTAETGQLDKDKNEIIHGWEVSFAPLDDPKIAMSIFMENGDGGWRAGYISRPFYKFALDQ